MCKNGAKALIKKTSKMQQEHSKTKPSLRGRISKDAAGREGAAAARVRSAVQGLQAIHS